MIVIDILILIIIGIGLLNEKDEALGLYAYIGFMVLMLIFCVQFSLRH